MVPVSAIKTGLYVACLDSVVSCGIVLDDVDFTQKIVDYVDSSDTNEAGVEEFRSFLLILHYQRPSISNVVRLFY